MQSGYEDSGLGRQLSVKGCNQNRPSTDLMLLAAYAIDQRTACNKKVSDYVLPLSLLGEYISTSSLSGLWRSKSSISGSSARCQWVKRPAHPATCGSDHVQLSRWHTDCAPTRRFRSGVCFPSHFHSCSLHCLLPAQHFRAACDLLLRNHLLVRTMLCEARPHFYRSCRGQAPPAWSWHPLSPPRIQ
jgi:hypothetical protein